MSKPFVSIWMVTYNHEDYISQAIESVLMQKTDFRYHLFIGEDCSTDNTGKICQDYANKYPEKITLIRNTINLGPNKNALNIYNLCFSSEAKYIAMLEGDDFWTDPLKLKKQIGFLEDFSDYGICAHNVEELNTFDLSKNRVIPNIKIDINYSLNDYILSNKTGTSSLVLKKNLIKYLPNNISKLPFGDLAIVLTILKHSNKKIKVFADVMAVYRIHKNSIHGKLQKDSLSLIKAYEQHVVFTKMIKKSLLKEDIYKLTILKKLNNTYLILKNLCLKQGLYWMYLKYAILKTMVSISIKISR